MVARRAALASMLAIPTLLRPVQAWVSRFSSGFRRDRYPRLATLEVMLEPSDISNSWARLVYDAMNLDGYKPPASMLDDPIIEKIRERCLSLISDGTPSLDSPIRMNLYRADKTEWGAPCDTRESVYISAKEVFEKGRWSEFRKAISLRHLESNHMNCSCGRSHPEKYKTLHSIRVQFFYSELFA